ncbi:alpha/beta hydrolase [Pseudohalocynthiibacter aestuariivivens]|nr:alpha/beta hydrolase [Pseudohalocynthiibacter aestuariivivens]QIE47344.1 alpha/beta hydrolase [Pseudohalocynthiibacter aestuariivivens]
MVKLALFFVILTTGGWLSLPALEAQAVYPFDSARVSPQAAGAHRVREVVQTRDGESTIIWVAAPEPGKPVILYFHGNAGNLALRAGRFNHFTTRGYGLIAPAYRGSSGSTGTPSEVTITADMQRLYANLGALIPGLKPSGVIVYGESLGTGVALKLTAAVPRSQPAGVVLEAPFSSLPDVVRASMPRLTPLIPQMTNIWDSATHAKKLRAPLLVLHGRNDPLIPIAQGRAVFDAAGSRQKWFVTVRGAGHHNVWRSTVMPRLWSFIDDQSANMR